MEVYGTSSWDRFWQITGPTLLVLIAINILLFIFWIVKRHWALGMMSSLITFCVSWIYMWSIGFFMMFIAVIQFAISLIVYFRERLKRKV